MRDHPAIEELAAYSPLAAPMTPQARRAPAFPVGWVLKSSAAPWTITPRPRILLGPSNAAPVSPYSRVAAPSFPPSLFPTSPACRRPPFGPPFPSPLGLNRPPHASP